MAKRPQVPPPTRAQMEEFIRVVSGRDLPFKRYNDTSLTRIYNYARGAQSRGEEFDLQRATGHPPKILEHQYQSVRNPNLRIPMLDDRYIGTCEHPAILADVTRLLKHPENQAEFVYIAFVGTMETKGGELVEDFGDSVNVSRADLASSVKKSGNLYDLYGLLRPDYDYGVWRKICQVSMRPAITVRGATRKPALPRKPAFTLIEPGSPGKKPKVRYVPR